MMLPKDTMECPRCGRKALVERSQDRYRCLWCSFQKDLSEPEPSNLLLVGIAIAILVLLLLV